MTNTVDFWGQAQAMRDELVARRRDLHQHPELSFEEYRTSGIVAEELNRLGFEVQTGIGKTGVIGILEGAEDGPTILVRADMDALPVEEANDVDYCSTETGKMHACGHDGHTSIALGVAKLLAGQRDSIAGRVKFVFQPAEEIAGGAKAMIDDGALRDPKPDYTLGLHLWNELPVGSLGVGIGPVMAGTSDFSVQITGKGGHGGIPQTTHDPVVCAAQIVTALQTIVSRNVSPLETAVVSATQIHAGQVFNVIPETAVIHGTLRTFSRNVRDLAEERMQTIATGIASAFNCTAEVDVKHYTDPVVNHTETTERIRAVAKKLGFDDDKLIDERTMAAEDVGLFMGDVPGTYFFVGSANTERDLDYPHHHPRFDIDEDALPIGVAVLSAAIADYILR